MNPSEKQELYQKLCKEWIICHSDRKGDKNQQEAIAFWNLNKTNPSAINLKINELKALRLQRQASMLNMFSKASSTSVEMSQSAQLAVEVQSIPPPAPVTSDVPPAPKVNNHAKAQQEAQQHLATLNSKIDALQAIKSAGLITETQKSDLKSIIHEKTATAKKLQTLKRDSERKRKARNKQKRKLEELKECDPETFGKLKDVVSTREAGAGRPRLETEQPELLKTIVNLVSPVSAAHDRRRMEMLRTCMTLDTLHKELIHEGYKLSRAALYLRLLPRNYTTIEGKNHVVTVPVKLIRAKNDLRKEHADTHFCAASIRMLKELAEFVGEKACFVVSQDNKATVPLGLAAAKKQSPILMHLYYRVILPDHDYVVASRHKLVPSVYAGISFNREQRTLSYSGPTYVAIRSAKHSKSNAETHAVDFRRLLKLENFKECCLTGAGSIVKPVVIIFTDGGPDENPRYPKVLIQAVRHFKDFNLDALFVATHAPGQSAYNQVERRMAPLSRDLSGIILPHDHFGSHLDASGKTIDKDLEKRNFAKAGMCLAEVWKDKVIDKFPVFAEYIEPNEIDVAGSMFTPTEEWLVSHVRQSQYVLQVVKCEDSSSCCTAPRTNIFTTVLQNRFLPAPVMFKEEDCGLIPCAFTSKEGRFGSLLQRIALPNVAPKYLHFNPLPFDAYCLSVNSDLETRICPICHVYFPTKISMESHRKACHRSSIESIMETIYNVAHGIIEEQKIEEDGEESLPIISDLQHWLYQCPFEDDIA